MEGFDAGPDRKTVRSLPLKVPRLIRERRLPCKAPIFAQKAASKLAAGIIQNRPRKFTQEKIRPKISPKISPQLSAKLPFLAANGPRLLYKSLVTTPHRAQGQRAFRAHIKVSPTNHVPAAAWT
jgi:hypothetical protein